MPSGGSHNQKFKPNTIQFMRQAGAEPVDPYPWRHTEKNKGRPWSPNTVQNWLRKNVDWTAYRDSQKLANYIMEIAQFEYQLHRLAMHVDAKKLDERQSSKYISDLNVVRGALSTLHFAVEKLRLRHDDPVPDGAKGGSLSDFKRKRPA